MPQSNPAEERDPFYVMAWYCKVIERINMGDSSTKMLPDGIGRKDCFWGYIRYRGSNRDSVLLCLRASRT
jgi:hypothetical protein